MGHAGQRPAGHGVVPDREWRLQHRRQLQPRQLQQPRGGQGHRSERVRIGSEGAERGDHPALEGPARAVPADPRQPDRVEEHALGPAGHVRRTAEVHLFPGAVVLHREAEAVTDPRRGPVGSDRPRPR
ncbi:hypothetical protein MICRO8M_110045 [Microbacterium sp. 8M]|nr:hypothetical protein MICRO8M_110045 [Microbacterium sp. 8M]